MDASVTDPPPLSLWRLTFVVGAHVLIVVLSTSVDALPEVFAAYLSPDFLFRNLALTTLTLLALFLPLSFTRAEQPVSWRDIAGRLGEGLLPALPFLVIASRSTPLPAAALPTVLAALLLSGAALLLLARLVGERYYAVLPAVAALPALLDYLRLDVLRVEHSALAAFSPYGVVLDAAGGRVPAAGFLLYALAIVALTVVPAWQAGLRESTQPES